MHKLILEIKVNIRFAKFTRNIKRYDQGYLPYC